MFQRRVKHKFHRRIRESVWPSMGPKRTAQYYRHRLFRNRQTTHQITAGLAIGMAVSFSPLLGTHFMEAVFLAWVFRVGKLAAFCGTAIGNPITFPLMFWADYKLGEYLFGLIGFDHLAALPEDLTWQYFLDNPLQLFLPMLLGGTLIGLIVWPLAYGLLYFPVRTARRIYHDRRHRK